MTQLIINGTEAVLPRNFSTTVKRENSFFTKSGEYTYDCTLNLDNPTNCNLYGFLHRLNKSEQIETSRPATLIADGHVYARGTEIITRWTDESVTIQIVSGASELNYFIGQDRKISSLNMGSVLSPSVGSSGGLQDTRVVYPTIVDAGNSAAYNYSIWDGEVFYIPIGMRRHQPKLVPLIRLVIEALGYTIGTDDLQDSLFKYAFIVNTKNTDEFCKMLPGWTVKDFLIEIEKFCGVVFVTNNTDPEHPTCDIVFRHRYYSSASHFTLRNVVDAYEAEVDDEGLDELSGKDIAYDLPDDKWSRHQRVSEGFMETVNIVECEDLYEVRNTLHIASPKTVAIDLSTGRKYIYRHIHKEDNWLDVFDEYHIIDRDVLEEVDYLADLKRENPKGDEPVKLKIVPAPIDWYMYKRYHAGFRNLINGIMRTVFIPSGDTSSDEDPESETEPSEEDDYDIYDAMGSFVEAEDSSASQLYVALCNGSHQRDGFMMPVAYIDAYQETQAAVDMGESNGVYEGSLLLSHLDSELYSNGYQIDTRYPVTIETYDPNVIDPRQVYVIRNRRFVCRDVEEVITAEGRQAKWKGTFYPIHLSDEALEHRWVLTHGVWDDHAAWIDDGRWMDLYDGALV